MKASAGGIFVTGGSGFVGRRLLPVLAASGQPVFALQHRSGGEIDRTTGVTPVQGDLLDPTTYQAVLRQCEVVVHLAAATGRATPEEHRRVNRDGTAALVGAARVAGVQRFLFMSSIAVIFDDVRNYPYAQAKRAAEAIVRESGLRFAIVRPTMVLGPGAPALGSLERLAMLPVIVVPGTGRARVQPIDVDRLASAVATIVEQDAFHNDEAILGGHDVVTMEALLRTIRRTRRGPADRAPIVRVPLGLLTLPLGLLERIGLTRLLPVTAGQLASFRYDGLATPNRADELLGGGGASIDQMVAPRPAEPRVTATAARHDELVRECRVFTRYLVGLEASGYVIEKYTAAHAAIPALVAAGRFDRALTALAGRGVIGAHLADSYAGMFARRGLLRRKLVVLLAILETSPPYHRTIDRAIGGHPVMATLHLAWRGLLGLAALAAGAIVVSAMRVFLFLVPDRRS